MKTIKNITEETWLEIRKTLGRHTSNRHLLPLQVAEYFQVARLTGMSIRAIAERVQKSTDLIKKLLDINKIINPTIKQSIIWGRTKEGLISFSSAKYLARLKSSKEQEILFNAVFEANLTKVEMKEIISLKNKTNKEIGKCIQNIVELRPKVIEKEIILGRITSKKLIKVLKNIKPFKRNKILKESLNNNLSTLKFDGAILKNEEFIIIGNTGTKTILVSLDGGFEDYITSILKEALL